MPVVQIRPMGVRVHQRLVAMPVRVLRGRREAEMRVGMVPVVVAMGMDVLLCGVLRGMGRTRPAAWFNLIGYWLLGLPLGYWLAFRSSWGLHGIWWGLCFGLGVVAISLVLFVRARGPSRIALPQPVGV